MRKAVVMTMLWHASLEQECGRFVLRASGRLQVIGKCSSAVGWARVGERKRWKATEAHCLMTLTLMQARRLSPQQKS